MNQELFQKLYYDRKLTRRDIAKNFGFSETQVKYWRRKFGLPPRTFRRLIRYKLTFSSSAPLAYVLGIMLGDGYLIESKRSRGTQYIVKLRTTDLLFAEEFCLNLKRLGMNARVSHCPSEPNVHVALAYCKAFYEWYKGLSLKNIEEIAKEHPIDFIKGFYESEGYYNEKHLSLSMYNNEKEILELIDLSLKQLNFSFRLNGPYPEYVLQTGIHKQTERFLQIVNPCIKGVDYRGNKRHLTVHRDVRSGV